MKVFSTEDMIKFANMKVADLKAELKKRGIKGYSKMKKAELQEKVLSIWESEREAEATDTEEVNELKYRIEDLEGELEEVNNELTELLDGTAEIAGYMEVNQSFVKKMMKDLAKIYHPDKCGNTEDMIKLNEFKEAFKL